MFALTTASAPAVNPFEELYTALGITADEAILIFTVYISMFCAALVVLSLVTMICVIVAAARTSKLKKINKNLEVLVDLNAKLLEEAQKPAVRPQAMPPQRPMMPPPPPQGRW